MPNINVYDAKLYNFFKHSFRKHNFILHFVKFVFYIRKVDYPHIVFLCSAVGRKSGQKKTASQEPQFIAFGTQLFIPGQRTVTRKARGVRMRGLISPPSR